VGELSPWHLAIIALLLFVLFGYKKLPDATRSLGRSMRIFKSEVKGLHDDEPKQVETAQPVQVTEQVTPPVKSASGAEVPARPEARTEPDRT
jgi:sec-independent protein translocase protein TatA